MLYKLSMAKPGWSGTITQKNKQKMPKKYNYVNKLFFIVSLSADILFQQKARLVLIRSGNFLLWSWIRRKAIPKSQCLVSSRTHHRIAIGRHCQLQYTLGMSSEIDLLCHRWISPHGQLIIGITVRWDQLIIVLSKEQCAHLRVRVHRVHAVAIIDIPEFDATICCASTCCEHIWLPGTPGESTDGSLMLVECVQWRWWCGCCARFRCPDVHQVVIATWGEIFAICRPFETTNFLCMAIETADEMITLTDVVVDDLAVAGAWNGGIDCYQIWNSIEIAEISPDDTMNEFHASEPTLAACPVITRSLRILLQSQSSTLPLFVPTANIWPSWIQASEHVCSFVSFSKRISIVPDSAFHR